MHDKRSTKALKVQYEMRSLLRALPLAHTTTGEVHLRAGANMLGYLCPVIPVHLHAFQQKQRLLVTPVLRALLCSQKPPVSFWLVAMT